MLGIIAHHCVVHSGLSNSTLMLNRAICYVIIPLGKIGFTCFLAISVWFLVDKEFKASRLVTIWLEVLFYTVTLGFLAIFAGVNVTPTWIMGLFLPVGGSSHGFAAAYLALYAFLPVLQIVARSISKSQAVFSSLLLVYLQVCSRLFAQTGVTDEVLHPFPSEFLLFVMCWFIMLVVRRWYPSIVKHGTAWLLIFLFTWGLISIAQPLSHHGNQFASLVCMNATDESSFLYLIAGFGLFFAVLNLPKRHSVAVNKIASTTFGVLLIHDHNTFRTVLWEKVLGANGWANSPNMLFYVLLCSAGLFAIGALVDCVRQLLYARLTMNSSHYVKLINSLDNLLQSIGAK